jgi:hypothetical protein
MYVSWTVARRNSATLILAVLGLSAIGGLSTVMDPVLVLAPIALLCLLLLALRAPRFVALAILLFLPFLGLARRATGSYRTPIDPLTLAAPVLAIACLLILSQGQPKLLRTPLSQAVAAMVGIGVLEIFNPQQGNPIVGMAGAGLFVGPLVWFFLGRRIGDQVTLDRVVKILRVVALVVAVYGVKQLVFGFSGFEQAWISAKLADYHALDISGSTRPFSTFASGAEYSYFLALGAVLFTVWRGTIGRALKVFIVVALLVTAFYAGSRSIFVTGVAAVVIVALVSRIRSLGRALAICVVAALIGLAMLSLVPLASGESTADKIQNRTLAGLSNPFDPKVSTLGLHLEAFRAGVWAGLKSPLGHGGASVNQAGAKLAGKVASAEHDVPNVLLAYGWAGGLLLALIFVRTYRVLQVCVAHRRRDLFAPAAFVLALFGAWFAGELYAISALVWFFLGSIDRQLSEEADDGMHTEAGMQLHGPAAPGEAKAGAPTPAGGAGTI